ncbi:hypothetical protein Ahy_B05g074097 [Arachis hypogaea]|uniref:Uncharacterized protein n=1 Tax=Arachis hypogaea TaxID=3818 RepID=A0A444YXW2_ARAHY|nr:hypothetical protein Ahy_B05g074097 [Arachis hypogaea]
MAASQGDCCHVMGTRRHLSRGKCPQPNPRLLVWLPNFTNPLIRVPPPHTPIHRVTCLLELLPPRSLLGMGCRQQHLLVR